MAPHVLPCANAWPEVIIRVRLYNSTYAQTSDHDVQDAARLGTWTTRPSSFPSPGSREKLACLRHGQRSFPASIRSRIECRTSCRADGCDSTVCQSRSDTRNRIPSTSLYSNATMPFWPICTIRPPQWSCSRLSSPKFPHHRLHLRNLHRRGGGEPLRKMRRGGTSTRLKGPGRQASLIPSFAASRKTACRT